MTHYYKVSNARDMRISRKERKIALANNMNCQEGHLGGYIKASPSRLRLVYVSITAIVQPIRQLSGAGYTKHWVYVRCWT